MLCKQEWNIEEKTVKPLFVITGKKEVTLNVLRVFDRINVLNACSRRRTVTFLYVDRTHQIVRIAADTLGAETGVYRRTKPLGLHRSGE